MPNYCYRCKHCDSAVEEFRQISQVDDAAPDCCDAPMVRDFQAEWGGQAVRGDYATPIEMHSLSLNTNADIRDFRRRNPGVEISSKRGDPLYGVPVIKNRTQKLETMKNEGFIERN